MAFANIGGGGALLMLFGPAAVGAGAGALLWKKHRLAGAAIGLGVGFGATMAYARYQTAQTQKLLGQNIKPATTLQTGQGYALTLTSGADPHTATALFTSSGFTQIGDVGATVMGTWSGANGAPVPAGIIASSG